MFHTLHALGGLGAQTHLLVQTMADKMAPTALPINAPGLCPLLAMLPITAPVVPPASAPDADIHIMFSPKS